MSCHWREIAVSDARPVYRLDLTSPRFLESRRNIRSLKASERLAERSLKVARHRLSCEEGTENTNETRLRNVRQDNPLQSTEEVTTEGTLSNILEYFKEP